VLLPIAKTSVRAALLFRRKSPEQLPLLANLNLLAPGGAGLDDSGGDRVARLT
jgi:hypothetical protein